MGNIMSSLNIRIPDSIADRLQVLAKETGRTKSYYVRQVLEEKIEELEDYYLALQSLEKVRTGKSKIWSHKEIESGSDLDN